MWFHLEPAPVSSHSRLCTNASLRGKESSFPRHCSFKGIMHTLARRLDNRLRVYPNFSLVRCRPLCPETLRGSPGIRQLPLPLFLSSSISVLLFSRRELASRLTVLDLMYGSCLLAQLFCHFSRRAQIRLFPPEGRQSFLHPSPGRSVFLLFPQQPSRGY